MDLVVAVVEESYAGRRKLYLDDIWTLIVGAQGILTTDWIFKDQLPMG